MNWADLTRNWAQSYEMLQRRFPNLEISAMPFVKQDQLRFENYLAATHDMALEDARNALDAYLSDMPEPEKELDKAAS